MINGTRLPVCTRLPARAWLPLLACSCLLSACATIVSGTRQSVKIDSVPQGAKVFTATLPMNQHGALDERKEVGVTPMTVKISRKDGVVEIEKEGYKLTRVPMHRGFNPWFLGNVLLTSMLSSSIDLSTGAVKTYDPDQYLVELSKDENYVPRAATNEAVPATAAGQVGATTAPPDQTEEPVVPDVRPLAPPAPKPEPPSRK